MKNPQWCVKREYRINLEVMVKQSGLSEDFAYIPVRCEGIDWGSFLPGKTKKVDIENLAVVRYDPGTGTPLVFDEDAEEEKGFIIPHRFDPDHRPFALSFGCLKGDLTWLAPFLPRKQSYSIYFDLQKDNNRVPEYKGLIGDGDIFVQKRGRLTVPGWSRPIFYGDKLFGKKGMIVGAFHGVYFFEHAGNTGSLPDFINRGRLKDKDGNLIIGIPVFYDLDEDGVLDLVTAKDNATLEWFRNIGTNEKPVFEGPEFLKDEKGSPLDLTKYLKDKERIVRLADGTVNKRYPSMPVIHAHGGRVRIHAQPQFVDWSKNGKPHLLVGTNGFLIDFEQVKPGCFREGVCLKDEKGGIFRGDGECSMVYDWNGDGLPDILMGNYHGFVNYYENRGLKNNAPALRAGGKLKIETEPTGSFPMTAHVNNRLSLFTGNVYGEVRLYTKVDVTKTGEPVLKDQGYLKIKNAWTSRMMPVCRYADMDRDGKKDLLSGDIRGGIFLYKNIGTNRNPVFAGACQLKDKNGLIKIEGGPDPIMPEDGYSKPVTADLTGDGNPDILVGTGLGRIFLYRSLGLDKKGVPHFEKGRIIKDSRGNDIMCHHMSAVEVTDWDGDGNMDLIVSGQKGVHALEDDDLDGESQVRWYKGIGRDKTGFPVFAPYVPIKAQGDGLFQNRPVPPIVGTWEGEKVLHVAQGIFRPLNKKTPGKIEFIRYYPSALIQAKEEFVGAYPTFSDLAEDDGLIVYSSCVSAIFAFRKSFVINRGYLSAGFRFASLQSIDDSVRKKLNKRINKPAITIETSRSRIKVTKKHHIVCVRSIPVSDNAGRAGPLEGVSSFTDFLDDQKNKMPPDKKVELKMAYDSKYLFVYLKCNEPIMDRLICNMEHNNNPMEGDDHIAVIIDPDIRSKSYYFWYINPRGYYKELNVDRAIKEPVGPYQAGSKGKITVFARQDSKSYWLKMFFPFKKLGFGPDTKKSFSFDIRRNRRIYGNKIRAKEQRLPPESFLWSGDIQGRVRVYF